MTPTTQLTSAGVYVGLLTAALAASAPLRASLGAWGASIEKTVQAEYQEVYDRLGIDARYVHQTPLHPFPITQEAAAQKDTAAETAPTRFPALATSQDDDDTPAITTMPEYRAAAERIYHSSRILAQHRWEKRRFQNEK
jgi:hypothetical protein